MFTLQLCNLLQKNKGGGVYFAAFVVCYFSKKLNQK